MNQRNIHKTSAREHTHTEHVDRNNLALKFQANTHNATHTTRKEIKKHFTSQQSLTKLYGSIIQHYGCH